MKSILIQTIFLIRMHYFKNKAKITFFWTPCRILQNTCSTKKNILFIQTPILIEYVQVSSYLVEKWQFGGRGGFSKITNKTPILWTPSIYWAPCILVIMNSIFILGFNRHIGGQNRLIVKKIRILSHLVQKLDKKAVFNFFGHPVQPKILLFVYTVLLFLIHGHPVGY